MKIPKRLYLVLSCIPLFLAIGLTFTELKEAYDYYKENGFPWLLIISISLVIGLVIHLILLYYEKISDRAKNIHEVIINLIIASICTAFALWFTVLLASIGQDREILITSGAYWLLLLLLMIYIFSLVFWFRVIYLFKKYRTSGCKGTVPDSQS
jgi:peptidoglycan biosynthesis protein MviN/MurJ (putative lipid II flippase)